MVRDVMKNRKKYETEAAAGGGGSQKNIRTGDFPEVRYTAVFLLLFPQVGSRAFFFCRTFFFEPCSFCLMSFFERKTALLFFFFSSYVQSIPFSLSLFSFRFCLFFSTCWGLFPIVFPFLSSFLFIFFFSQLSLLYRFVCCCAKINCEPHYIARTRIQRRASVIFKCPEHFPSNYCCATKLLVMFETNRAIFCTLYIVYSSFGWTP